MAVSPVPTSELKTAAFPVAVSPVPAPKLKPLAERESKIDHRIAELRQKRAEITQGGLYRFPGYPSSELPARLRSNVQIRPG